jgi:uncharacterized phiE125 gp8 family phage protein
MSSYIDTTSPCAYPYKLVTAASELPVSLTEIKTLLRITGSDDDTLLTLLITTATDQAERYTRRDFVTKTYITYRDYFEDIIELRRSPLIAITNIYYDDISNVNTLLSSATYTTVFDPAYSRIKLAPTYIWPQVFNKEQAVRITFTAGYGAAASVPSAIKLAISMMVANLYENRGDCGTAEAGCGPCATGIPSGARGLLDSYRIVELVPYPPHRRYSW